MASRTGFAAPKGDIYELQHQVGSDTSAEANNDTFATDINGIKTGTTQDWKDMHRLGKAQEFKRNFRSFSILGLSSVVMATWVAFLGSCQFSLINGGLAGTVWTFVGIWVLSIPVALSLAEMSSMAPTSGGQYHWTSEFAPPQYQKFLSYIVGWLSALGMQAAIATTAFGGASVIVQMAVLGSGNGYTYEPSQWEFTWTSTIVTMAVVTFAVLFNTVGAKHLPLFEGLILALHVVGIFAILIPLWVLSPKISAEKVFTEFSNYGGWPTQGGACVVGILTATGSLGGVDTSVHLAEEVKHASKTVPRMMIATILLNGCLGLLMVISFCFCITDLEGMFITTTSPFPYVDVLYAATGSTGGTIAMVSLITVLNICANLSVVAAGSRQAFAFARDGGLPFSPWFRKVVTIGTPIPVNAILASLFITIIVSLLNLGSATAFNSVVGLLAGSGGVSYTVSIGCVLWRRMTGMPLPKAHFSLGKWGIPINTIAILYTMLQVVMSFFPLFAQVETETMNYGVVMFVGVSAIAIVYYVVKGRHVYKGPVVHINYD